MANTEWENQTYISEFILLGFGNLPRLHLLLFLLFLVIYILTVAGNILIILLVLTDHHLHTPMYLFLWNLSFLETCYTSNSLPRMLESLLTGNRAISVCGCFIQNYIFGLLAGSESYLLSAMSYDRYLAICRPLHYAALMNRRFCLQLVAASWISGLLGNSIILYVLSRLVFCGPNKIDHFFCDLIPVIKLSCSDTHLMELVVFLLSSIFSLPPLLLTLSSYLCILSAILRIPSTTGRQKAFSTCSSHLIVVTLFYGTIIIVYLLPKNNALRDLNKVFSLFYTVLTPMANPFIYTLRNKEVKNVLSKDVRKIRAFLRENTGT
ncbi:olfactory receptor 6B1-like [Malaclemys terrapin pileata]|uniref:olfactory receptor 6B1-like n=1 Tax=Malaclemys terrapin pileata TaxID=2991368 RepID=UPI0023A79CF9|nr:olfactory receptor 6B1-like [Malaclemys terrapin pileata]